VTDDEGTAVALVAEARRIASLTPGLTETVFALGAGDRVVAIDSASDYPAAAATLPHVADFGTVDVEKLVALHADLVLAGGDGYTPSDAVTRLRSLGIPVIVAYAPTVAGVLEDVTLVGDAIGRSAQAADLVSAMRADVDALSAAVRDGPKPRVFYEVDASNAIYGPADRSFLAEMVALAGGDPITSGVPDNFQIPLERLVAADPQVIILGDAAFGASAEVVRQRSGWSGMSAVKSGAIRVADDKLITRPGPRLALGLRSLVLAIHPDAHLP
jgi:iron complex transport system substrate-binding protein